MKKYYTYILFTIFSGFCVAQEVVSMSLSSCENKSYPEYIRNRIIEKKIENDTLFLNVGLVLNCCSSLYSELSLKNDTLYLKVINESDYTCMCDCCFELDIEALGVPDTNFRLIHQFETLDFTTDSLKDKLVSRELQHFKSKYIFPRLDEINDFTEINQTDSLERKVGIWELNYDNSKKVKFRSKHFISKNGESKIAWIVRFDLEGNIEEVCGINRENEGTCADKYTYDELFKNKP